MSDYYSFITLPILDKDSDIKEIEKLFIKIREKENDYFNFSIIKRGRWATISGIIRLGISNSIIDYIPEQYYYYFTIINEQRKIIE